MDDKVKRKLIIYGTGKFADYIAYCFNNDSDYEVVAHCLEKSYISDLANSKSKPPLLVFEEIEKQYSPEKYSFFIAVGNDKIRERIFIAAKEKLFHLASYISSYCIHWENLQIGENVFISEDSAIQPFVTIEDNCLLLGAKIGHHSIIKKNSLLSINIVGANVLVGENTFLGINSCVISNINIGANNIIGMGAIINKSTQSNEIYSTPAAVKRNISSTDIHNKHLKNNKS